MAITDTTNNVREPIRGTFSTGWLLPNVRGACCRRRLIRFADGRRVLAPAALRGFKIRVR